MALFTWDDSFSVGIKKIDMQHQKLVDMINNLYDAMKEGRGRKQLGTILDGLAEYTVIHFKTEEDWFDEFGYENTEEHKKIHTEFVQKVVDFKEKVAQNKVTITIDIMNFLRDWLTEHIKGTDKHYTKFLNSKGIR